MTQRYVVGIAQLVIVRAPEQAACLGLGSCVAVIIYDASTKIGGVLHALLPRAPNGSSDHQKYADTGTRKLVQEMILKGARKEKMVAKIVGGAQMFSRLNIAITDIGKENILETKKALRQLGIPLVAADVEGIRGRSAILDTETGKVTVQTAFSPTKVI
jgi:chemotaxis protein CheD